MKKHKSEIPEYIPTSEESTYQTGPAKPHAEHRGLIAVLMILVTFLGGIASAMGLMNIRLLQQLAERSPGVEDVSIYSDGTQDSGLSPETEEQAPSLPADSSVELRLADAQPSPENTPEPGVIVSQNRSSIVSVYCQDVHASQSDTLGVIFDSNGFILTNAYPISECDRIYVQLENGRSCRATVVGIDEFTDLAVLYIHASGLTCAQFAKDAAPGDSAIAVSTEFAPMEGQIRELLDYAIGEDTIHLLQVDISGVFGPVYNVSGQIIGFSSPYLETADGIAAVPSAMVKEVAEQIISCGTIHGRPSLGLELEEVQPLHQQFWQLPQGLRITQTPNENSQLSGLRQGDVLISLDGQPISDRESLNAVLRCLRAGDRVEAVIVRNQVEMTVYLTVQSTGK